MCFGIQDTFRRYKFIFQNAIGVDQKRQQIATCVVDKKKAKTKSIASALSERSNTIKPSP